VAEADLAEVEGASRQRWRSAVATPVPCGIEFRVLPQHDGVRRTSCIDSMRAKANVDVAMAPYIV